MSDTTLEPIKTRAAKLFWAKLREFAAWESGGALRRSHTASVPQQRAAMYCRSTASLRAASEWQLETLPDYFRGESNRFGDVLPLELRIQLQDFVRRHVVGHHIEDHGNRNAEPTDAGRATHLISTDRDAGEGHGFNLAPASSASSRNRVRVRDTACANGAQHAREQDSAFR